MMRTPAAPRSLALALWLAACAAPAPRPVAPAHAPTPAAPPTRDPDPDGDGLVGAADHCPDAPEDCDGTDDADGCPDPDDDGDGVPDVCDACPREHGVASLQGCPPVVIEAANLQIIQRVYFDENRAVISPRAVPVLDAAAAVLRENPRVRRLELRGNASRGERDAQRLSQRRAEAVMAWLVAHGVEASRLTARGYGTDAPIADNADARGRAQNRRTDFHVDDVEPAPPSPRPERRVVPQGCPDAPPPPPRGPCAPPAAHE
ncbi:MAG: OmpA family protein [Polyangiales bacterium]